MNIQGLDWIIVAIVIGAGVFGYEKGLVKCAGGTIALLMGIAAAWTLNQTAVIYMEQNYGMVTSIALHFQNALKVTAFEDTGGMTSLLVSPSLYAFDGMAFHIARLLASAILFLVILLVIYAVMQFIVHILSLVFSWGLLGTTNKVGGLAFQVVKVTFVLAVIAGLGMPLARSLSAGGIGISQDVMYLLDSSYFIPQFENIFRLMGTIFGISS